MLVFASPRGSQNDQKCIQKQLVILVPFQLQKNTLPASILLQLGSLLGLPRHPQGASKTSLKPLLESSWAILAATSIFWPPWGYPRAKFSSIFDQILIIFEAAFALKIASTPFTNDSFVKTTAFATTLDFQLLNVTIGFHGLPL